MSDSPKIVCKNVWKIFGTYPERTLNDIDPSLSRAEVQEQTGHVIAVKDVSFEVKKGETFVVMGLSGSGKSTLVRCISRLIEPTAGEMYIDGEDIMKYSDAQLTELRRFRMSMVFQHFGLFPHRRVIDNISFGLEIRGMDKKERKAKAMEVLESAYGAESARWYQRWRLFFLACEELFGYRGGTEWMVGHYRLTRVSPS